MFGFWDRFHPPPTAAGGGVQHTFRIFCKADEEYCLTVRDGCVALAPANSSDEHQHWFKDMRFSTNVQDEEGNPAFSLVNKATGLAMSHFGGSFRPVKLVAFNPYYLDDSAMWTGNSDLARSFGCIRTRCDIGLSLGLIDVHDGANSVRLSVTCEGDRHLWKILPWRDEACSVGTANAGPAFRIVCKASEGLSITVRDGPVCLAPTDPNDEYQHWILDMRYGDMIRDEDGNPAFALVNRATGDAISQSAGEDSPVKLVPYSLGYLDKSVWWSKSTGDEFQCIRMVDDIELNLSAVPCDKDYSTVEDGTKVVLSNWCESDNQYWRMVRLCKSPCITH